MNIHAPIAIVHGTDDEVIPFSHGKKLYRLANDPKLFLKAEGYGHNNLPWSLIDQSLSWLKEEA